MWVYEIGTSPYFTNVAPGEVTDLPTESTPQEAPEDPEEASDARSPVYTDGQQVEYPPYEGEQIQVLPVQYQPRQPENPEVVVVDDTDINVDGESTRERLKLFLSNEANIFCCFLIVLPHVFSVLIQSWDMREQ